MLEAFTLETFSELVNDEFRIRLESGDILVVHLAEATPGGASPLPSGRAPFAILFRGPAPPILPQRLYALEHDELGAFELFLVPLEPDGDGARYEAVFG